MEVGTIYMCEWSKMPRDVKLQKRLKKNGTLNGPCKWSAPNLTTDGQFWLFPTVGFLNRPHPVQIKLKELGNSTSKGEFI